MHTEPTNTAVADLAELLHPFNGLSKWTRRDTAQATLPERVLALGFTEPREGFRGSVGFAPLADGNVGNPMDLPWDTFERSYQFLRRC